VNNIVAVGLIVSVSLPAIVEYNNYRWIRQVEGAIPRLLRDVAEAVRSGVMLPQAVEQAAQKGYGPLSKEFERVIGQFVLGASWREAVMSLTKRVKSASAMRLATILVEANQSGGRTSDVLDMSVELFSSLHQYKEEQLNNMKPYLYAIYASIVVFLIISVVVVTQFLAPLSSSIETSMSMRGNSVTVLDINYYISILFWASIVEALFGGLIAGKIGDRVYLAGLRHSILLMIMSIVSFNLVGGLI
jgi:flagellar protein FlaJ